MSEPPFGHDAEELASARESLMATLRKLGYDGAIFWLVEVIPGTALVVGAVVLTVVLIRRHRQKERAACHDTRGETAARDDDDIGPDLSTC